MADRAQVLRKQLAHTLEQTDLGSLGEKYEGKVRDCYISEDGVRTIVVTDRLSAFDVVLCTIPFKGQVLNQLAQYWFELAAEIAPNHVISVPDPNVMRAKECEPLAAEFVVRSYLTGVTSTSIWRAYERGDRVFCGHSLAEGMKKNQALPEPILTPSTKAAKGDHDVSVSREELIDMGHISSEDFDRAGAMAMRLFEFGRKRAAERGLILVDTKYEMGKTPDGEIVVIDEVHTPDSSRYWYLDDFQKRFAAGQEPRSLDKEYVRRWMKETHNYDGDGAAPQVPDDVRVEAAMRYIEIFELVTGREFVPEPCEDLHGRIARNLGVGE